MSVRKSSHGTIFLIVSSGSPRALIASSLRSTSKKPFCPMTRPLHPPMTAHGHRVRFVATWREQFFEVPIYVIKQSNPTYPALVYPMPTSHPCVNRLFLAAGDTAGFWPTPTYALGRYQLDNNGLPMRDKPLMTYLIVNICLDLGKTAVTNRC